MCGSLEVKGWIWVVEETERGRERERGLYCLWSCKGIWNMKREREREKERETEREREISYIGVRRKDNSHITFERLRSSMKSVCERARH